MQRGASRHEHERRSRLFLPRSHGRARPAQGGARRPVVRRLDRSRDRHQVDRARLPPGAGRRGRDQARRPRAPRHRRHLHHAAGRGRPARLSRSQGRRRRSHHDLGRRRADHVPQSRGDRAVRLVALHVRPQARRPPAPHPRADAAPLGRERPHRLAGLWARLRRAHPRRAIRADRGGRALPSPRAPRPVRAEDRRLRRPRAKKWKVIALDDRREEGMQASTQGIEMKFYSFTEQSYPDAWFKDADSLRVSLPNRHCDPEVASRLYNRYLDEWMLADELGLNIIVNEHHATATCMSASVHLTLAILARQPRLARLLGLGTPIANRNDPLRVAEEMAIIDVISRGRLEMGFIKGVPYEIVPANARPVAVMDRFWEAHDLIIKAMTTRDGPFSWEGENFQYRSVNIWPRPYQQPQPPVR